MDEDDILQKIEAESRARQAGVDRMLRNMGRADEADKLKAKLRQIEMGVDGARSTWAALSARQRSVIETMRDGGCRIVRADGVKHYVTQGYPRGYTFKVGGLATVRNLIARGLLDCEGGAFDPEAVLTLSDRARFVLKHGPTFTA